MTITLTDSVGSDQSQRWSWAASEEAVLSKCNSAGQPGL